VLKPASVAACRDGTNHERIENIMNKTDLQLKQDVEAELGWDPKINAAQIGVAVDQGAVSLMGTVAGGSAQPSLAPTTASSRRQV
jgi:osmotically-inducible protein OsmY